MEELQQHLINERNIAICLFECLNHTNNNPQNIEKIGTFWIDDDHIFLHTQTFSNFTSKKSNTINRYLRDHGFTCRKLNQFETSSILEAKNITINFDGISTIRSNENIHKSDAHQLIYDLPYLNPQNNSQSTDDFSIVAEMNISTTDSLFQHEEDYNDFQYEEDYNDFQYEEDYNDFQYEEYFKF